MWVNVLLSWTLVFIGLVGIVSIRLDLILLLMCVELIFVAGLVGISSWCFLISATCSVMILYLLTVAASETALILSVYVLFYRWFDSLNISDVIVYMNS